MEKSPLRVGVWQCAPALRRVAENAQRIDQASASSEAQILITPELSLTGYDVRDAVHELAMPAHELLHHLHPRQGRSVLVGFIERGDTGIPCNAAALVADRVQHLHRKLYLPTYGMFDEGRYFGRGQRLDLCTYEGWKLGILVCEDFWHPGLIYALAAQGMDALLVMAAGAGRGAWQGGMHGSPFASTGTWEGIARTTAQLYGIYVALCNRVGVEGALTFAGASLIVGPDGTVHQRAAGVEEAMLEWEFDPEEIRRARTPYSHLRDDDPHLVIRALEQGLAR